MKKTERKWMWKRALSMLLVCAMLFTSADLTVLAVEPDAGTEMTTPGEEGETETGNEVTDEPNQPEESDGTEDKNEGNESEEGTNDGKNPGDESGTGDVTDDPGVSEDTEDEGNQASDQAGEEDKSGSDQTEKPDDTTGDEGDNDETQSTEESVSGNSVSENSVSENSMAEVNAASSFGRALTSAVPVEVTEVGSGIGCNINEIVVIGKQAEVSLCAPSMTDGTLVVGIYDETGNKQIATGSTEISLNDSTATVSLEGDLPEYFLVKGFLVETETLRPLCDNYESKDYTKKMQDFYAQTIDDFAEEQVINLDENKDDNFIVFSDYVKVIRQGTDGTKNQVVECDEENLIYKFENPDESVIALQVGDTIAYLCEDNAAIITTISAITMNEDSSLAEIQGQDQDLNDVFEFIKIGAKNPRNEVQRRNVVDDLWDQCEEVLKIHFDSDNIEVKMGNGDIIDQKVSWNDIDALISKLSKLYGDAEFWKEFREDINTIKTSGLSADLTVSAYADGWIHYKKADAPIGAKINIFYETEFKLQIGEPEDDEDNSGKNSAETGSGNESKDSKKIKFPSFQVDLPIPGVPDQILNVSCKIYPEIDVEGYIYFDAIVKGSSGVEVTYSDGWRTEKNNSAPNWEFSIGAEAVFYPHIVFEPSIEFIKIKTIEVKEGEEKKERKSVFKATAKIKAGVEITITAIAGNISNYKEHMCMNMPDRLKIPNNPFRCVSGNAVPKVNLGCTVEVFGNEFEIDEGVDDFNEFLNDILDNLAKDFYFSFAFNDRDDGKDGIIWDKKCPHWEDRKNIRVTDLDGKGVEGATAISSLDKSKETTDADGYTGLKLNEGTQNIYVELDGVRYSQAVQIPEDMEEGLGVLNITINPENPLDDSTAAEKVYIANYIDSLVRYVCYATITKDGSLYMWGGNSCGQLGIGRDVGSLDYPVKVLDGVREFQFSPDGRTCAAMTTGKELYIWGNNTNGLVGNGEQGICWEPYKVSISGKKAEKFCFSSDSSNSAVICDDGQLYVWGFNGYNQIDNTDRSIVTEPTYILPNVKEISIQDGTCIAIADREIKDDSGITINKKEDALFLWGNNDYGKAGEDFVEKRTVAPQDVKGEFCASVDHFVMQDWTGAVIKKDGSLHMWGRGYSEEYVTEEGRGFVYSKNIYCEGNQIAEVYLDGMVSAAVTVNGDLYTWEDNSQVTSIQSAPTPVVTKKILEDVEKFHKVGDTYAAIVKGKKLYMWGKNNAYQLGDGTVESCINPKMVLQDLEVENFEFLYGGSLSVAIIRNGASKDLYMWGTYEGSIANGSFEPYGYFTEPELILEDVDRIMPYPVRPSDSLGTIQYYYANFAAILADGGLYEWLDGNRSLQEIVKDEGAAESLCVFYNAGTSARPYTYNRIICLGKGGGVYTWGSKQDPKKEYLFGSQYLFQDPTKAASEYSLTDITEEMSVQSFGTEEALISTYAEATSQQSADFTNLLPNELYNIYAMKSREAEDCLASDNLLYIGQSTSDGDGNLNVTFEMKEAYAAPAIFCVGFKRTDLAEAEITIPDIVYDGNRHIPEVTVTYNGQVLKRGVDYKAYLDAYVEEVGEYELTIKGIGLYCGERKATFHVIEGNAPGEDDDPDNPSPDPVYGEVLKEDIPADGNIPEGLWIAGVAEAGYDYTGKAIKPEVRVYDHKKRLAEKTDYTIAYKNNIKAYGYTSDDQAFEAKKAPTITVTGKGNYTGKETQSFRILPLDISVKANASDGTGTEADTVQTDDNVFAADNMTITANKKNQKPVPALMWNDKKLKNNTDYTITYYDSTGVKKLDYVKEAGNYYIELTGKGNFTGTRRVNLTVIGQSDQLKLMSKMTVAKIPNQVYTGSAIEPALTVKDGKTTLNKDEHYTVSYSLNKEIGTAYAVVTGIEAKGYSGTKRVSFKITGGSVSKATVTGLAGQTFVYGGVSKEPELTVSVKVAGVEKTLEKGTNYKVTWQKNRDAGTATAIITGVGGYTGTLKKNFKIQAFDIAANADGRFTAVLTQDEVPYAKGGTKPEVAVTFHRDNGTTQKLQEGKDYTLSYKNHTTLNDGSRADKLPTVTIKGKGNFKGTYGTKPTYKITAQDLGSLTLTAADKTYQNKKNIFATKVTITDLNGKVLKAGTDYGKVFTYAYKNETILDNGTVRAAGAAVDKNDIIPAGTVLEVTVSAKGSYTGTKTGEYRIARASIASASVSIPKQTYTGQAITPDKDQITVKIKGKLVDASQYEIIPGSYKNNVKKGTASVTIRGVDNYGGTKTVKFTIRAKGFLWWWRKG